MPKVSPIQNSFNAGELSPQLEGRTDIQKYGNGCRTMLNMIPKVHGPAQKRPGTRFVKEVRDSSAKTRLIPFEYNTEQAYVLEFSNLKMRVYKDGGAVLETALSITAITQANPAVVTIAGHPYANGDQVYISGVGGMTELNGRYFTVAGAAANTFQLSGEDSTSHTAYTSGGTAARVYEITTPYATADLFDIQYAQTADVMYLAHESHHPQKLSRTGHTSWTIADAPLDWPAFLDENVDTTHTVTVAAVTGTGVALTSSAALFDADMVGGYFKFTEVLGSKYDQWAAGASVSSGDYRYYNGNLYQSGTTTTTGSRPPIHTSGAESDGAVTWTYIHSGEGYVQVASYTNSTTATCDVISRVPASVTSGTHRWSQGAWSDYQGYPKAVAFYEQRLWFGGTSLSPQTLWASISGSYEDFQTGTNADSGLSYTIASQEVNAILWLAPGAALAIGTSGAEFIASGSSAENAITPTDVRIVRQSTYGSKRIRPFRIGRAVLFIQRAGKKVREFTYQFESDAYVAPDMTILAEHITEGGITEVAYQQEPDQIFWCVRSDGTLLGMTYERAEDVIAWHRHEIGGTGAEVESIAVIPHPDGDQDQLWAIVKLTVNSATKRYVVYFEKYYTDADSFFVDVGGTYDGSATTTVSGLDWLEGETVTILADGAAHPDRTVADGAITLARSAEKVQVGLYYEPTIKLMRPDAGAADGTAQGKTKRIHNITFRLYQTGPGLYYGDGTDEDLLPARDSNDAMDNPVALISGDTSLLSWPGGYETDGTIQIKHKLPFPFTLVAVMPQMVTNDR